MSIPFAFIARTGAHDDAGLKAQASWRDAFLAHFVQQSLAQCWALPAGSLVRAVLRQAQFTTGEHAQTLRMPMTLELLTIDFAQRLMMAGRKVVLTSTEYCLLAYLAQYTGRVLIQDLLLEQVWGRAYVGEGHMLQVNINRLRHKLEPDPAYTRYLLTEPGVGYLLATQSEVQGAP